MTTAAVSEELDQLAESIRDRIQALGGALPPQEIHFVLLAQFFRYNVEQGGFAQLLYNLQGNYLEDVEQMLVASSATVACDFYVQALRTSLADVEAYREFLGGEYTDASPVKDALHTISLAYFEKRVDFSEEASQFIELSRGTVQSYLEAGV